MKKLPTFDFIFGLMFMRIIMTKEKVFTKQLQEEEVSIPDALLLSDAILENLATIRNDDTTINSLLKSKKLIRCQNANVTTKLDVHPKGRTKIQQHCVVVPRIFTEGNVLGP